MVRIKIIFTALLFVLIFGCEKELKIDMPDIQEKIVVDGWIENGRYPHVILTKSASYVSRIDSSSYFQFVKTEATVVVSNGEVEEKLTLMYDDDYFPPHVFRGTDFKGEPGKSYRLDVYVNGVHLTAHATIPQVVAPDSVWFELDATRDSAGFVWMQLTDDGNEENYYRLFTRIKNKEAEYTPTHLSAINDRFFNGKTMSAPIYKGARGLMESQSDFRFKVDDTIFVKVSSLTKDAFEFWQNYEYEVMNAGNPFAASSNNLSTNIQGGGLGIWCGYASSTSLVIAR